MGGSLETDHCLEFTEHFPAGPAGDGAVDGHADVFGDEADRAISEGKLSTSGVVAAGVFAVVVEEAGGIAGVCIDRVISFHSDHVLGGVSRGIAITACAEAVATVAAGHAIGVGCSAEFVGDFSDQEGVGGSVEDICHADSAVQEEHAISAVGEVGHLILLVVIERGCTGAGVVGADLVVVFGCISAAGGMGRALEHGEHGGATGEYLASGSLRSGISSHDVTDSLIEISLFKERQYSGVPCPSISVGAVCGISADDVGGWEGGVNVVVVVECESNLFEVIFALSSASGFAGLLNGGEQEGDENGDDCDDNQQFDQREGGTTGAVVAVFMKNFSVGFAGLGCSSPGGFVSGKASMTAISLILQNLSIFRSLKN